jgi:tetratricopeptide (TPR) repeat protein
MRKLTQYLPVLLALSLAGFSGSGCTKEIRKSRHLARGKRDFQALKYDQAEIEYLKVRHVAPTNSEAIRQLGLIYAEQGRMVDAYRFLLKAAELEPANPAIHLKLSTTALALGDYKKAVDEAYLVLAKQPGQTDALEVLANSVFGSKAVDDAKQRIDNLRQSDHDRAGYHLAAGIFYLRGQDTTNAEIELKKALELDPKSTGSLAALGGVYWLRNDLEAADKAFKSAFELSPIRSIRRVKYGEFKVSTGKKDEARQLVEEITRQAPDYLPAWIFLAELAFSDKKYDDCNSMLQRVLARDPENFEAGMLNGNLNLAKGDATNAISAFNRLGTTVYSRSPVLKLQLARAQLLAGDSTRALITLNQAVKDNPNFAEAILLMATLNIRKGDLPAAISSLTDLTSKQPQLWQAHLLLIDAYLAQKNLDQALAAAQRMLPLFPKASEVPLLIGSVQLRQKKPAEARQSFENALALSTNNLAVIEQLVSLDITEQKYSNALDRVQKLAEQFPREPAPLFLSARVHLAAAQNIAEAEKRKNGAASSMSASFANVAAAQADVNQAEAALLKAIDMAPGFRAAYLLLEQLYVACGRQQQALDRLNGLLSKTNDVGVLLRVGQLQESLTNYPAARDAYEKLLAADPDPATAAVALNNLAFLYSDRFNDVNKAYPLIEKARRLFPEDASIADTMGWILYRRGEYQRALVFLEESAAKLSDHADIQFHLGLVHYALGDEAPARTALEQAAQGKDFQDKDEADRRLAILAVDPNNPDAAARTLLEKRLQENPADPIALVRLGAIQEREGAVNKAIESYQAALKANEKNPQVLLKLAQLYLASSADGAQKAFALAKSAHDLAPDDVRISALLGRLAYQTGDAKWASSLLEDSARKLPNDPAIAYDLAWAYYTLGRVADAQNTMQSAAQASSFPKAEDARGFLAAVAAAGDPARVNQMGPEVQKMLGADPNYLPALMLSALIQEEQGNFKQAAQIYDQILGRYKFFTPATRNLGLLYFAHLNDDEKAYDLVSKARQFYPQDAELAKALGVLTYRKGNYARASQLLKEGAASRKSDAELLYYLGMAQYQLKSKAESKASLQEAVALNLQAKLADDAKRVLAELK